MRSVIRQLITMILVAWMLTGCASGPQPMLAPSPPRLAPPNLTTPCQELAQPSSGQLMELLANHIEVAQQYQLCRERHRALSEWAQPPPRIGGGDE